MAAADLIEVEGEVTEVLRGCTFKVNAKFADKEEEVLCHLGGKLKQFNIKVTLADKVTIQVSPYDLTKGRITYRHR